MSLPPDWFKIPPERREKARAWVREEARKPKPRVSIRKLKAGIGCSTDHATVICRLYRGDLLPKAETGRWDVSAAGESGKVGAAGKGGRPRKTAESTVGSKEAEELAGKILGAGNTEDLDRLELTVANLAIRGALSKWQTEAAQKGIANVRASLTARQLAKAVDGPGAVLLVTEEGRELLLAYEGIVSDERRVRLLALIKREAEADALEHPNVDQAAEEAA